MPVERLDSSLALTGESGEIFHKNARMLPLYTLGIPMVPISWNFLFVVNLLSNDQVGVLRASPLWIQDCIQGFSNFQIYDLHLRALV